MTRLRLFGLGLALALAAWGQGGRNAAGRGAPGSAPAATQTGGRGGRGAEAGTAAPASGTLDFYNYDPTAGSSQPISDAPASETHQKITVNGQALAYTTRAGFLALRNATSGAAEAHVFYTFYAKDGESAGRPVMFFFGGAPGMSAAWQEFGGLGPKRIKADSESAWADNPQTLLGAADLVFVNPVGTGFSRPDRPERAMAFWNTAADTASLGEFVRSFLSHYDRKTSPLYLAGEDWGTGRVAGLAGYLNDHNVPVHGVALLSMTETADALAGDTQYITLLPSLILAAWHHKKLTPELNAMSSEQIAGEARKFASREYLHALYKGDRMTADERAKAVADLSRLTGLGKQFLISNGLRVSLDRFNGELLREQHKGLSPSDARVSGFVPPTQFAGRGGGGGFGFGAPAPPIDFNLSSLGASFATAYEAYVRKELTFTSAANAIYYLSSGGVGTFTSTGNDDAALAAAFARNPKLRMFVSVNYFDLNAPFFATEYTLAHLNVAPEVRAKNITVTHLEAGGMPYLDTKALGRLQQGLTEFVSAR
jgi:carboxypeptidase C (cathepsin A)